MIAQKRRILRLPTLRRTDLLALLILLVLAGASFFAETSAHSGKAASSRRLGNHTPGSMTLNVERKNHTATQLADGTVLLIGGENGSGLVRRAEILNIESQTARLSAKLKTPRANHAAVKLADGRILVTGGHNKAPLNSSEIYDAARGKFVKGPHMAEARAGHTATLMADGRVLLVGGDSNGTAEIFDPSTNAFTLIAARPSSKRAFHSAVLLKSGEVLLAGGLTDNNSPVNTAELFYPAQGTFSDAMQMKSARVRPTLNLLPDGKIQVIGGDGESTIEMFNSQLHYFTARAHILDQVNDSDRLAGILATPSRAGLIRKAGSESLSTQSDALPPMDALLDRGDHSLTDDPQSGRAVVAGGVSPSGQVLKSVVVMSSSAASVTTNQTDYQPGDQVIISGEGWQPGETVTLLLHREPQTSEDTTLTAVADAEGKFTNSDYTVMFKDIDVTFTLTATGNSSGRTAQTTFTDAVSGCITTLDVQDLTPNTAFQGQTNVPMMSFSFTVNASCADQDFQMACITYITGAMRSVTDVSSVKLYRESNPTFDATPVSTSTFDPATDVLLGSDTTADGSNRFCIDPNYIVPKNTGNCCRHTFYVVVDISPTATVGNKVDVRIEPDQLTFPSGTWPPAGQTNTFNRAGETTIQAPPCTSIDCPDDITQSNDPGMCGANVAFTAPTGDPSCGTITCRDPQMNVVMSGSFFPVGMTTVTCTSTAGPSCSFTVTVNDTENPMIDCPANITQSNDPDMCGANVNYPPPTVSDNCPGVMEPMCSPASGSFFNVGMTTVTCTVADANGNTAMCMFTVTVNDTEPPAIDCPANITAVTAVTCPPSSSTVVTFAPTSDDNCAGVTFVCVPPSGSPFNVGTTTVTCTATDASGNTATCSFTVTVFNGCLQDDTNPGNVVLFNTFTGEYRFCCNGVLVASGIGTVTSKGCSITIQHNAPTYRVTIKPEFAVKKGSASIQKPIGSVLCTITDRNMLNNSCLCSVRPPT